MAGRQSRPSTSADLHVFSGAHVDPRDKREDDERWRAEWDGPPVTDFVMAGRQSRPSTSSSAPAASGVPVDAQDEPAHDAQGGCRGASPPTIMTAAGFLPAIPEADGRVSECSLSFPLVMAGRQSRPSTSADLHVFSGAHVDPRDKREDDERWRAEWDGPPVTDFVMAGHRPDHPPWMLSARVSALPWILATSARMTGGKPPIMVGPPGSANKLGEAGGKGSGPPASSAYH
jgi:hypothetical protein